MEPYKNNDFNNFQKVISGSLKIEDNFQISVKSKFADSVWDFSDEDNLRNLSIYKCKQLIDWGRFCFVLPEAIIHEVKILAFFYAKCPRVITSSHRAIQYGLKSNTYCPDLKKLLQFLTHLYNLNNNYNSLAPLESEKKENGIRIQSIFDISIHSLNIAAQSFYSKRQQVIRKLLMLFNNPIIQQYIITDYSRNKKFQWNKNDIKNLSFKIPPRVEPGESRGYSDKPIPDKLLNLLVNQSTSDILSFLRRMKITFSCDYNLRVNKDIESNLIFKTFPDLYSMFEDYSEIRTKDFSYMSRSHKRSSGANKQRKIFKLKYNLSVNAFKIILGRVQLAAQYLLLQFTGIRYSEAVQLKRGCIEQIGINDYIIRGTIIKNKPVDLLTNSDYWVACPIVRERVLQEVWKNEKC